METSRLNKNAKLILLYWLANSITEEYILIKTVKKSTYYENYSKTYGLVKIRQFKRDSTVFIYVYCMKKCNGNLF